MRIPHFFQLFLAAVAGGAVVALWHPWQGEAGSVRARAVTAAQSPQAKTAVVEKKPEAADSRGPVVNWNPPGGKNSAMAEPAEPSPTAANDPGVADSVNPEPEMKPADALAAYNKLSRPEEKEQFLVEYLDRLARSDADVALSWVKSLPASKLRQAALEQTLQTIAETAPDKAVTEALSLHGVARTNALSRVFETWAAGEPKDALAAALALTQSELRSAMVEHVAASWGAGAPSEAVAAIAVDNSIPAEQKRLALKVIAGIWAQGEPQPAVAWAQEFSKSTADRGPLTAALGNWASQDPSAAAAYLKEHPDAALVEAVAPMIAEGWVENEPQRAAEWVLALPAGPARTAGLEALIRGWSAWDPQNAMHWAIGIADPAARKQALAVGGQNWSRQSPESFKEWQSALAPGDAAQVAAALSETGTAKAPVAPVKP